MNDARAFPRKSYLFVAIFRSVGQQRLQQAVGCREEVEKRHPQKAIL